MRSKQKAVYLKTLLGQVLAELLFIMQVSHHQLMVFRGQMSEGQTWGRNSFSILP